MRNGKFLRWFRRRPRSLSGLVYSAALRQPGSSACHRLDINFAEVRFSGQATLDTAQPFGPENRSQDQSACLSFRLKLQDME